MEGKWRWIAVTAIAPVAWGSTYWVTRHALPIDYPLWGGALRALPAGLLLLAIRRRLPRGSWWWRSAVLGTLNMGAFFVLVYLAGQLLPTSVAAIVMATSSITMALFGWALLAERPGAAALLGAVVGLVGVAIMLGGTGGAIDPVGVVASLAAMVMSSVGFVLAKRWRDGPEVVSGTAWQLVAGGIVLLPVALFVEGAPPAMTGGRLLGYGYVAVIATAVAYTAWFAGLRRLRAASVGLVGLLNPVTGVFCGVALAGESFGPAQLAGLALVLAAVAAGQRRPGSPESPTPPRQLRPGEHRHADRPVADVETGAAESSG